MQGLHQWPRNIAPCSGCREATGLQEATETSAKHRYLAGRKQAVESLAHIIRLRQARFERLQVLQKLRGDGLSGIVPDDGAQFGLGIEGQAVVNTPDVPVLIAQTMAALAVGIVDQCVEKRDSLELSGILITQGKKVLLRVNLHVELHTTQPMRSLTQHCGWDQTPIQGLTDNIGRVLTQAQCAIWKIPQGALPALGLVDRQAGPFPILNTHQEGVVGTPGHLSLKVDVSCRQQSLYLFKFDSRGLLAGVL